MIRSCPRGIRFGIGLAFVSCCLFGGDRIAAAADKPPLSAARLNVWANWAIRTGELQFDPPRNLPRGDTLEVSDVGVLLEMERDADNPYVRVLLDQVEIELRRQQLLQRTRSRQIMEPYYVKMDRIVGKKLAVVEQANLSDDDRVKQLGELQDQLMAVYSEGLTAVAKSIGLAKFEFMAASADPMHDVKLEAARGATIDMVRPVTAGLLNEAGVPDTDWPWSNYKAGDTAQLYGSYYCRIRSNGKEAISTHKVGRTTEKLQFVGP